MYDFLLAVHILAAVLWVGGGATMHLFGRLATKEGPESQAVFVRQSNMIGPRFYAPLSMLLLIAGILLVNEAGYEFSDPWVGIGMAGWLFSFAVGVGYYGRAGKRFEEAAAAEGPASGAAQAVYRQVVNVNVVELAILFFVVIVMAVKPG
jgi:uncharacterized membrane protein